MSPPDLEIGFSPPKVGGLIEAALPMSNLKKESLPKSLNPLTPESLNPYGVTAPWDKLARFSSTADQPTQQACSDQRTGSRFRNKGG